jgi:hypothetical protein
MMVGKRSEHVFARRGRKMLAGEPDLEELLAEPIVRLLMDVDRVTRDDLWSLAERVRASLEIAPAAQGRGGEP